MLGNVRYCEKLSPEDAKLAACAKAASADAVARAFAAGLSVLALKDGKLMRFYPDGHAEEEKVQSHG